MKQRCLCCRNFTLQERNMFEICPVCYWEDDGWHYGGGVNKLILAEAQENYRVIKVSDEEYIKHVRPPTEEEKT